MRKPAESWAYRSCLSTSSTRPRFSLAVNAIPANPQGEPPFDAARMPAGSVILDMAYGGAATPLVTAAEAAGLGTVSGREVLLAQAFGSSGR